MGRNLSVRVEKGKGDESSNNRESAMPTFLQSLTAIVDPELDLKVKMLLVQNIKR
jgi:hypothetical protein